MKRAHRHQLYEIDLKNLIAFCTACGYTEIVLRKSLTGPELKPFCVVRAKEIEERQRQKVELSRETRQSRRIRQGYHVLSEINTETMRAVCSKCGPTDIWKTYGHKRKVTYICATKSREYMRIYKRSHTKSRPSNPHALSQIDEEARTAVCAKCGPVEIEVRLANKNVTRRCINEIKEKLEARQNRNKARNAKQDQK
jgi:hypothetical protein